MRHRPGHFCDTAWLVIGLVAWEGVPTNQADDLYSYLTEALPDNGLETERRCGTNDRSVVSLVQFLFLWSLLVVCERSSACVHLSFCPSRFVHTITTDTILMEKGLASSEEIDLLGKGR